MADDNDEKLEAAGEAGLPVAEDFRYHLINRKDLAEIQNSGIALSPTTGTKDERALASKNVMFRHKHLGSNPPRSMDFNTKSLLRVRPAAFEDQGQGVAMAAPESIEYYDKEAKDFIPLSSAKILRRAPSRQEEHHTVPVAENIDYHLRNLHGGELGIVPNQTQTMSQKEHLRSHAKEVAVDAKRARLERIMAEKKAAAQLQQQAQAGVEEAARRKAAEMAAVIDRAKTLPSGPRPAPFKADPAIAEAYQKEMEAKRKAKRRFAEGGEAQPEVVIPAENQTSPSIVDQYNALLGKGINAVADIIPNQVKEAGQQYHEALEGAKQGDYSKLGETATQTAMGTVGAAPSLPTPRALGLYSKLEHVVNTKMGNSATPEQVRAILRDIKPEEAEWSGVHDFIGNKTKISKQELLDHLSNNQLELKELEHKENPKTLVRPNESSPYMQLPEVRRFFERTDAPTPGHLMLEFQNDSDVYRAVTRLDPSLAGDEQWVSKVANSLGGPFYHMPMKTGAEPKFRQYTLPGGENYREILIQKPPKPIKYPPRNVSERYDDLNSAAQAGYGRNYNDLTANQQQSVMSDVHVQLPSFPEEAQYHSSHWDEPNVLAHMRVKDRIDAEKKKNLFIEEIQSDWHQAGREKGYAGEIKPEAVQKAYGISPDEWKFASEQTRANWTRRATEDLKQGFVPNAPFKKNWHELAMKRLVKEAAEKGYDRVSWTTGEQQAERYNLSKHIESIGYEKRGEDLFNIRVNGKNGEIVYQNQSADPKYLEELLGKEMTKKIVNDEGRPYGLGKIKYLEGLDLKVGGEGMKGFYDKMLVDYANKLGKKYGAKVGKTKIFAPSNGVRMQEVHSLDITPAMREAIMREGLPLFAAGGQVQHFDDGGGVTAAPPTGVMLDTQPTSTPASGPMEQLSTTDPADADNSINVVDPLTGQVGSLPANQWQDAQQAGYRLASPDEAQTARYREKYGSAGQQAIAALEGAGRGLAGPLAPMAEQALGVPAENIVGRQAVNPWSAGLGEAAGLVAPALLTGGASTLGRATLPGIMTTAGEAGAKALGLAGATEGASTAMKIGSAAAKGMIENAVYQSSNEVTKIVLGNEPNVGLAAADIGLMGLIGGAFGAGFGALSPLWHAAEGSKMGSVLKAISDKLGGREGQIPDYLQEAMGQVGVELDPVTRSALMENPHIRQMVKTLEQSDTTGAGKEVQVRLANSKQALTDAIVKSLGKAPEELDALREMSLYEAGKRQGDILASEYASKYAPVGDVFEANERQWSGLSNTADERIPGVRHDHFSIMTPENPMNTQLSTEENAARLDGFRAELKEKKIPFVEGLGMFNGASENSFLISHGLSGKGAAINEHFVNDLAKRYGQSSAIHRLGRRNKLALVNEPDGIVKIIDGAGMATGNDLKNYTQIGGKRFSLNLDNAEPRPQRLFHYSEVPHALYEIDPQFAGTSSVRGAEQNRPGRLPAQHFYEEGAEPEDLVLQRAKTMHVISRPNSIVDVASPEGQELVAKAQALGHTQEEISDQFERLAVESGYSGIKNSESGMPGTVKLFSPQRVGDFSFLDADQYARLREISDQMLPRALSAGTHGGLSDKVADWAVREGHTISPSSDIMKEVARIQKEIPGLQTLGDLKAYEQRIGENMIDKDVTNKAMRRAGMQLKSIFRDAQADIVEHQLGKDASGEAVEAFRKARADYRRIADLHDELQDRLHIKGASIPQYDKALREMAQTDGEALMRRLSGHNDAHLLSFLDQHFPQSAENLRQFHIDNALRAAVLKTKEGSPLNLAELRRQIEKVMSPEMRAFSINDKALGDLKAVGQMVDYMNQLPHNFSNTARAHDALQKYGLSTLVGAVSMLTGHDPALSTGAALISGLISKEAPDAARLMLLKFLGSDKEINAGAFKTAIDYVQAVMKGDSLMRRSVKALVTKGTLPGSEATIEKLTGERERLDKRIRAIERDPSVLEKVSGSLGHYMPEQAQAIGASAARSVQYLASKRPVIQGAAPMDSKRRPSAAEEAKYSRALDIANNPLIILQHIKKGNLTPSDIEAISTMNPDLYQRLSQTMMTEANNFVAKGNLIPYKTRLMMSMFLGQPLDSSMTPAGIVGAQPMPKPQPQTSGGRLNKLGKGSNKMATTPGQATEARRAYRD